MFFQKKKSKELVIAVPLIILGIIFIIIATHTSHSPMEQAESWMAKIGHFFQNLWGKISGHHPREISQHSGRLVGFLVCGIFLILCGFLLIYRRFKNR